MLSLRPYLRHSAALLLCLCLLGCGPDRSTPYFAVPPSSDFTLTLTPVSLSVLQGNSVPLNITLTPSNGFNAATQLTLAASSSNAISCSASTCSATIAAGTSSSSFSVDVPPSAPLGTYTLTVTAVSGTVIHTATAQLTVLPPTTGPDFTFLAGPATTSVVAGTSSPAYVFAITPQNNFSAPVTVIATTVPSGIVCNASPCAATIPAGSTQLASTLTLTPASSLTAGNYTVIFSATSGSLIHTATVTLTVTAAPQPDFSISVSPLVATITAGDNTPSYSFTVTPINGFNGIVSISPTVPSGFTCQQSPCTAASSSSIIPNAFSFTSSTALAAGVDAISFTATSGALTHTVSTSLTVLEPQAPDITYISCTGTLPTTTPSMHTTGFVYTGDPSPAAVVYEPRHNLVYTTNFQLNEVDVIDPEAQTVLSRVPIPAPQGLDLSLDHKTLFVGTQTAYFYTIDTDSLCVTSKVRIPTNISIFGYQLYPYTPSVLADGSAFFVLANPGFGGSALVHWTASGGVQAVTNLTDSVNAMVPSGDRQHIFFAGFQGEYARYDLSTNSFGTLTNTANGTHGTIYAVNQDGSRVLAYLVGNNAALYDGSFNLLTQSTVQGYFDGVIANSDFTRFYSLNMGTEDGIFNVLDATTLSSLGSLPGFQFTANYDDAPTGVDGVGRIITRETMGVGFIDTTAAPVATLPYSDIRTSGYYYAFSPDNPSAGLSTVLNGAGFTSNPTVVFNQRNASYTAPSAQTTSPNTIAMTAPSLTKGCADALVSFPTGAKSFAADAYCYTPVVLYTDNDSGPTTGGTTMKIYGFGWGALQPQVTIGGLSATVTANQWNGISPYPLPTWILSVTVPPGSIGTADVVVSTSTGSTTVPHGFTYINRSVTPLASGAQPFEMVYDPSRLLLYWTDYANNEIDVYSTSSNQVQQRIPTAAGPRGIALTPDHTKLLYVTTSDRKLTVLDASTYQLLKQATLPTNSNTVFSSMSTGAPIYIAPLKNNTALVNTDFGNGGETGIYLYSFASNTFTNPSMATQLYTGGDYEIRASSDGSHATLDGLIYNVDTNTTASSTALQYADMDLSSDGVVYSAATGTYDNTGALQTTFTGPDMLFGIFTDGLQGSVSGKRLNEAGSLYYVPFSKLIRVMDAAHGTLLTTIAQTDTTVSNDLGLSRLLVIDPAGKRLWTMTSSGLVTYTFAADPLSIGEIQISNGQMTVLGSGFEQGTTLQVDSTAVTLSISNPQSASAVLPALTSGFHAVTLTRPDGQTYVREAAIVIP